MEEEGNGQLYLSWLLKWLNCSCGDGELTTAITVLPWTHMHTGSRLNMVLDALHRERLVKGHASHSHCAVPLPWLPLMVQWWKMMPTYILWLWVQPPLLTTSPPWKPTGFDVLPTLSIADPQSHQQHPVISKAAHFVHRKRRSSRRECCSGINWQSLTTFSVGLQRFPWLNRKGSSFLYP